MKSLSFRNLATSTAGQNYDIIITTANCICCSYNSEEQAKTCHPRSLHSGVTWRIKKKWGSMGKIKILSWSGWYRRYRCSDFPSVLQQC